MGDLDLTSDGLDANDKFTAGTRKLAAAYTDGGKTVEFKFELNVTAVVITSIEVKLVADDTKATTLTTKDQFLNLITVTATYNDGSKAPLSASLCGSDFVVGKVGEQEVTVNYGVVKNTVKITVEKVKAEIVADGLEYTYDGTKTTQTVDSGAKLVYNGVEISGVTLTYSDNTFTDVPASGTIEITVSFAGDGIYDECEKKVTVTVKKAVYDMDGVEFSQKNYKFDYDPAQTRSASLLGTLPAGVTCTVTYKDAAGNVVMDGSNPATSVKNAGTYTVVASFTGDSVNYEAIGDITAEIVIDKITASVDVSGISKGWTYDGQEHGLGGAVKVAGENGIKYVVDGTEYDELEGVSIDMERTQVLDEQYNPAEFKNDGTYTIRYYFTKTNYAYKLPASPEYFELRDVRITSNPYTVTITVPEDGVQTTYDGNAHEIPKPSISEVTDALHGNETVDGSKITVRYQIYRTGASVPPATATPNWTVTNVGTYNVVVSVFVEGYTESIGTATYTYSIAQAENAITEFDVPEYVIFEDETLYDFGVKATFDANKKVLTFSKNANGPYTEALPDSTGIWYVKATVPGTDNYTEVTTEAKFFDVRTKSISSGDNTVSGGEGVGADWTLEVNPDDVSEISLSQQDILGGYRVELKDSRGNVVTNVEEEYTVRIKLTDELAEKKNMKVFFYDSEGKATAVQGVEVDADGYLKFQTKSFGRFVLSEEIPVDKGPMILLIVVIVLGVVAAAGIAACVVVFLKKRKGGNK